MIFQQNDVILFQGDSITDWGRNHEDASSLGVGYAMMVAARLGHLYPEKNLTFLTVVLVATVLLIYRDVGIRIVWI